MSTIHVHDSDTAYDGTCAECLCGTEGCPGVIEYRCEAIDQDGNPTDHRLACGDGECVFQAIAHLLTHSDPRTRNGVMVYEWAVSS